MHRPTALRPDADGAQGVRLFHRHDALGEIGRRPVHVLTVRRAAHDRIVDGAAVRRAQNQRLPGLRSDALKQSEEARPNDRDAAVPTRKLAASEVLARPSLHTGARLHGWLIVTGVRVNGVT
jgi:hypothetical protein